MTISTLWTYKFEIYGNLGLTEQWFRDLNEFVFDIWYILQVLLYDHIIIVASLLLFHEHSFISQYI